jgi:hypothetical protein
VLKDVFIAYIRRGICKASFKLCLGEILRKEIDGGEREKRFSAHFNAVVGAYMYERIQKQMANNSWTLPTRTGSMVTNFPIAPCGFH